MCVGLVTGSVWKRRKHLGDNGRQHVKESASSPPYTTIMKQLREPGQLTLDEDFRVRLKFDALQEKTE